MTDMAVCRWQTVEDGAPREGIDRWVKHEGHITEHILIALPVRHPDTHSPMRTHVVIRASQHTGEITLSLEFYQPEDDGA
jgi:hypothetical protein